MSQATPGPACCAKCGAPYQPTDGPSCKFCGEHHAIGDEPTRPGNFADPFAAAGNPFVVDSADANTVRHASSHSSAMAPSPSPMMRVTTDDGGYSRPIARPGPSRGKWIAIAGMVLALVLVASVVTAIASGSRHHHGHHHK